MTNEERAALADIVTQAIAPLREDIAGVGKRLDSLDSRMGIVEARWSFVQDSLGALQAGQAALTEQVGLVRDEQAGLGGVLALLGGQVTTVHLAILEVKARIDRLSKDNVTGRTRDQERLAKLERDVAALQAQSPGAPQ